MSRDNITSDYIKFEQLHKETEHFVLYYSELDEVCIDKIADSLENSYLRITNRLKQDHGQRIVIEIHSDLNQLHLALGLQNAPNWIRGGT